MRRRRVIPAVLAAAVAAAGVAAQQIQQGGHALDNNLRLGSGGYNGAVGGGGGQLRYASPYNVRSYSVYGGRGDYYNAFIDQRRYDPAGNYAAYAAPRPQGGAPAGRTTGPDAAAMDRYADAYAAGYEAAMRNAPDRPEPGETARQQMDEISYAIGYFLGETVRDALRRDGIDADLDGLIQGFRDGLSDAAPQVSREHIQAMMAEVHKRVMSEAARRLMGTDTEFQAQAQANLQRGREFREAYGARPDVVTMDNGIQYRILKEGEGPSPGPDSTVVVDYRVMRLDGTVIREGARAEIAVSSMTPGAAMVVQMMRKGSRWEVAIPPELAHGAAGQPPDIGPQETLFGVVELREIKAPGS